MQTPPRVTQSFAPLPTMTGTQTLALDDEPIVDLNAASNMLGYLKNATRRRQKLLRMTALVTFVVVVVITAVMPRTYKIETRILTHKTVLMNALVSPDRAVPPSADNPTAGVVELVKSREFNQDLIQDIDLVGLWESKRSVLMKSKDKLLAMVFGLPNQADVSEAYLKMLDDKIEISVNGDVILMNFEWTDPEVAYKLAIGGIARFLKMRQDLDLGEISETIQILSRDVEANRLEIQKTIKSMQKLFEERENDLANHNPGGTSHTSELRRHAKKTRFVAVRKPLAAEIVDTGTIEVRKQLAAKQTIISQAKKGYDERLKAAQDELDRVRASLGPDHPDVAEARRKYEAIAKAPQDLDAMEAEQARLAAQLNATQGSPIRVPQSKSQASSSPSDDAAFDMMRVPVSEDLYKEMEKDPEIQSVLAELKRGQDNHDVKMARLANAHIEAETASAAFDYRYKGTEPPVFPKRPVKPNVPLMLGGGLVAALVLGVIASVIADILSKTILEAWQIQRFVGVRVFGEIAEP